ncbi:MAG: protein translocase subunit SecF [Paracoccaceae bacterium]|nr:protein translocase subunit SecF [Paracoccaceae bacterium]
MRMRLVPDVTTINFFRLRKVTFGASMVAVVLSLVLVAVMGLNFGIDFKGGTTIRTESTSSVDVGAYRTALVPLDLGDVSITEVFDPSFGAERNVAMIRIQAQEGDEAATPQVIQAMEDALKAVDPLISFASVESVGPKVSGELIWSALLAVFGATGAILIYIWLRFEWQFAIGAVVALVHDVVVTVGIFAAFQIKFDLAVIAALLTILGYSINDTVVIFDRLRENLIKFKVMPLIDVMNLSVNETLSRTVMTSGTTLIALGALLWLGGDVIRGFVFAIFFGVIVGTYSTVYVAKNVVLYFGVKRDWTKKDDTPGTQFSNIDA